MYFSIPCRLTTWVRIRYRRSSHQSRKLVWRLDRIWRCKRIALCQSDLWHRSHIPGRSDFHKDWLLQSKRNKEDEDHPSAKIQFRRAIFIFFSFFFLQVHQSRIWWCQSGSERPDNLCYYTGNTFTRFLLLGFIHKCREVPLGCNEAQLTANITARVPPNWRAGDALWSLVSGWNCLSLLFVLEIGGRKSERGKWALWAEKSALRTRKIWKFSWLYRILYRSTY